MTEMPGLQPPSPERNTAYAQAASWAADIHGSLRASRRVAWIIAGAAVVVRPSRSHRPRRFDAVKDRRALYHPGGPRDRLCADDRRIKAGRIDPGRRRHPVLPRAVCDCARDLRRRRPARELPESHGVVRTERAQPVRPRDGSYQSRQPRLCSIRPTRSCKRR